MPGCIIQPCRCTLPILERGGGGKVYVGLHKRTNRGTWSRDATVRQRLFDCFLTNDMQWAAGKALDIGDLFCRDLLNHIKNSDPNANVVPGLLHMWKGISSSRPELRMRINVSDFNCINTLAAHVLLLPSGNGMTANIKSEYRRATQPGETLRVDNSPGPCFHSVVGSMIGGGSVTHHHRCGRGQTIRYATGAFDSDFISKPGSECSIHEQCEVTGHCHPQSTSTGGGHQ